MKEFALDVDVLEKILAGALKNTIDVHGPVTLALTTSAARRMSHSVVGFIQDEMVKRNRDTYVNRQIKELRDEIKYMKENLDKKNKSIHDLLEKLEAAGVQLKK